MSTEAAVVAEVALDAWASDFQFDPTITGTWVAIVECPLDLKP